MGQGREGPAPFLTVHTVGGVLPDQAVRDIPADWYPLKVEFLNQAREIVHSIDVDEPGVMQVPQLSSEYGPITVRLTLGNGEVIEEGPPGAPEQ